MDFMEHRVQFLISLIGLTFSCCGETARPKVEFNIAGLAVKNENGVIFFQDKPFTGKLYALSNQDTVFIREYTLGLEDGLHKLWFNQKQVSEIRYYQAGKKTGLHTGYWENGQKKYEYSFVNDLYAGTQYEWYPTGQVFSKKAYKEGHENGLQQVWTPDGKLKSNYEARNGRNYGNIGKKNCLSKT